MAVFARKERGAVTVIVALFITVLFGFMALSVDVARLYVERRALVSSADLSALAGAQMLWKSAADAEAQGEMIVTNNPTVNHSGPYSEPGGDLVTAKRQIEGTGCGANIDSTTGAVTLDPTLSMAGSSTYDCIQSTVTAPAFNFLFGSVLGFRPRSLSATSTAFMGNGAPRGTTVIPWILRDCPNTDQYPDESVADSPAECPYHFTDSFINDPSHIAITEFEESGVFVGASIAYEAIGCPNMSGFKEVFHGTDVYRSLNEAAPGYVPCRVAPGLRVRTRGGNLGSQLAGYLDARGVSTSTCANATAFNSALGRTGDGDGFVSIRQRNACLIQVAFAVYAAPTSRVPTVDDDVAGTPEQMQANVSEASSDNRFGNLANNKIVVVRRLAWFYITGFNNNIPIGVYLRAIDNQNSIINGPMNTCSSSTPISECAQHGIYVVKLVG